MDLPSRKRSHSQHLDGTLRPVEDNKSRRTSPSPHTGPATPSSTISSGYGYPMLGDGFVDLTLFVYHLLFFPADFLGVLYNMVVSVGAQS